MFKEVSVLLASTIITIYLLLCRILQKCIYYFKFLFLVTGEAIIGFALLPVVVFRKDAEKNARLIVSLELKLASLMGVNFTVRGVEHGRTVDGCIAVLNHQSFLDIYAGAAMFHSLQTEGPAYGISKRSALLFPGYGLLRYLAGLLIFIDRSNSRESRRIVTEAAVRAKKEKGTLVLFPEGTRNMGQRQLLPFKLGAFNSAIQCKLPILPVVVSPYTAFLDHKRQIFDSGTAVIHILPAINPEDFGTEDARELADRVAKLMQTEYDKLWAINAPKNKL